MGSIFIHAYKGFLGSANVPHDIAGARIDPPLSFRYRAALPHFAAICHESSYRSSSASAIDCDSQASADFQKLNGRTLKALLDKG